MTQIVKMKGMNKHFGKLHVLKDIDLTVEQGEVVVIIGASGSGKSTLIRCVNGLEEYESGSLNVDSHALAPKGGNQSTLADIRKEVGMVFQQFNLLPYLNLIDNVSLPCTLSAPRREAAIRRSGSVQAEAHRLLERLQLPTELFQRRAVAELSIGQQQRVAAARALIGAPELIIADEPTSALDGASRDRFMQLLLEELDQSNTTLLLVSHDPALSEYFSRHLTLEGAGSC